MNFENEKEHKVVISDYGDTLDPSAIDEIRMWTGVLGVLVNGMPVAFNPVKQLLKIEKEEEYYNRDFSEIKKCCQNIAEIREVKNFRPVIFEIINRIAELGNLEKRVNYYE